MDPKQCISVGFSPRGSKRRRQWSDPRHRSLWTLSAYHYLEPLRRNSKMSLRWERLDRRFRAFRIRGNAFLWKTGRYGKQDQIKKIKKGTVLTFGTYLRRGFAESNPSYRVVSVVVTLNGARCLFYDIRAKILTVYNFDIWAYFTVRCKLNYSMRVS